jgi:large subunit ribosomal protein L29
MKASEIRSLTEQELTLKETNLREELHKTRFNKYTGELADTARVKRIRRDLARVMTELTARQSAAATTAEG